MKKCALVLAAVTFTSFTAFAQTNAAHASAVGTWKLDVAKSSFGSEPAPKAVTLTILKDTAELCSWRVDVVDEKGQSMSYSWSGPQDGSMQPVKDAKDQIVGQESLKRDKDGVLLRHGADTNGGSSFDGHATLSADGNTITDVVTSKTKDGKSSTVTMSTSELHRRSRPLLRRLPQRQQVRQQSDTRRERRTAAAGGARTRSTCSGPCRTAPCSQPPSAAADPVVRRDHRRVGLVPRR